MKKETLYLMDENTLDIKMSELWDRIRNANNHSTDKVWDHEEDELGME